MTHRPPARQTEIGDRQEPGDAGLSRPRHILRQGGRMLEY
jgi:hypothetical protein